ncbi:MAG: acid phosphatase AphA [Vibrio splendidus]
MKKVLMLSLLACAVSGAASADPKAPATHDGISSSQLAEIGSDYIDGIDWVTVEQLRKELAGKPAMAVGFDIDDTVLFSSPGFYKGKMDFGSKYTKSQAFWDKMNCEYEVFSMPKLIGKELIAMHQERGDDIYFITGRTGSDCEITTDYLADQFGIKSMNKVIFAGTSKTEYMKMPHIKSNNIKIYYGDADGDIISARDAGAEGIRIMRSAGSSYRPIPENGQYGERVLINSQF